MYSVGAPHTWPQVLGALIWLMDSARVRPLTSLAKITRSFMWDRNQQNLICVTTAKNMTIAPFWYWLTVPLNLWFPAVQLHARTGPALLRLHRWQHWRRGRSGVQQGTQIFHAPQTSLVCFLLEIFVCLFGCDLVFFLLLALHGLHLWDLQQVHAGSRLVWGGGRRLPQLAEWAFFFFFWSALFHTEKTHKNSLIVLYCVSDSVNQWTTDITKPFWLILAHRQWWK